MPDRNVRTTEVRRKELKELKKSDVIQDAVDAKGPGGVTYTDVLDVVLPEEVTTETRVDRSKVFIEIGDGVADRLVGNRADQDDEGLAGQYVTADMVMEHYIEEFRKEHGNNE